MAIDSFKPGSAAGQDVLRPCHLKQLIGKLIGETGNHFLGTLAVFVNLVLSCFIPAHIKDTFNCANLCALNKDGEGIMPIAVGNTLRSLATYVGQKRAVLTAWDIISDQLNWVSKRKEVAKWQFMRSDSI